MILMAKCLLYIKPTSNVIVNAEHENQMETITNTTSSIDDSVFLYVSEVKLMFFHFGSSDPNLDAMTLQIQTHIWDRNPSFS